MSSQLKPRTGWVGTSWVGTIDAQTTRKSSSPWAERYGRDWRIVSDGRSYRVQQRTEVNPNGDVWVCVTDERREKVVTGDFYSWEYYECLFETRWLWRARRRLKREIRRAATSSPTWTVVEYGDYERF